MSFHAKKEVLILIKPMGRIWIIILTALLMASCSFSDCLKSLDSVSEKSDESSDNVSDEAGVFNDNGKSIVNALEFTDPIENNGESGADDVNTADEVIVLTVNTFIPNSEKPDRENSGIPEKELNSESIQMEIRLFFADRSLAAEGKPGPYGFVTPVIRKVPATSGILRAALNELIKGPLPGEKNLGPVIPAASVVNKVIINDRVAVIDFNKAVISDHPGGTLGGVITKQALVFTAAQFESVDGVLVTVEGKPWDDGHFTWDTPIYEEDILNSLQKSN